MFISKSVLCGRPAIQTKIKELIAARFKNHLFANLKCKSVPHQKVAYHSTTNSIQFAERSHNSGYFLISLKGYSKGKNAYIS